MGNVKELQPPLIAGSLPEKMNGSPEFAGLECGRSHPIELVKHLMRLMHGHCNFSCTLICLPSVSSGLVAIAGIGRNAGQLATRFRNGGMKQDIFRMVMDRKTDLFIDNIHQSPYAELIPGWYYEAIAAQSFVMLPLVSEGELTGMIYGDYSRPHASSPPELAHGNMLKWRNRLIQALQPGPKPES